MQAVQQSRNDDPTVHIVDDDPAVRDSLRELVESAGYRADLYASAEEFLERIPQGPGCLLLDIRMPGMSGLELQDRLLIRGVTLPVLVVTGHGDVPTAVKALKLGAFDFVQKPFSDEHLLHLIHSAVETDRALRRRRASADDVQERLASLTPREREVLNLVVSGHPNKQIAFQLGITQRTVEIHRAHVMEKMQADSLAELVRQVCEAEGGCTPGIAC